MTLEFIRKKDEELIEYLIRLYENKEKYGLNNIEIGELLNREDEVEYDESRWRKLYQSYKTHFEPYIMKQEAKDDKGYNQAILDKYELAKIEAKKADIRYRDIKREYNKMIREEARFDALRDELLEAIEVVEPVNNPIESIEKRPVKEAMVIISDLHIGMVVQSEYNTYNVEVAKERVNQLKQRTFEKVKSEGITKLHIVNLGDAIHGLIHVSARVDSEFSVIKQIVTAKEIFKDFILTFLEEGIEVSFKSVSGNHSRLIPNKQDSNFVEENFEKLLPEMLNETFANYKNYSSEIDKEGLIFFEISGQRICLAHGDLDKGNNAVNKITQLTGKTIKYLFTGHYHHLFVKEHGYSTHFGVGSVSGLDNYALSGRFAGRPSQQIITFNDKDIEENIVVYLD